MNDCQTNDVQADTKTGQTDRQDRQNRQNRQTDRLRGAMRSHAGGNFTNQSCPPVVASRPYAALYGIIKNVILHYGCKVFQSLRSELEAKDSFLGRQAAKNVFFVIFRRDAGAGRGGGGGQ